ncbi:MAG: DUF5671 domain-containing protein [bacterium]
MNQHSNAKFAFFYMLSLVGLIFMAVATGIIIFNIIDMSILDVNNYFNDGGLKFGISALIIATPIYYILMWQINKQLRLGHLSKESAVRRWLTYLILFVTSVVVIGWLIAIINMFLNGELTTKFIFKALTVLIIAVIVFTYYLYDIKRENFGKNKVVSWYFYASLILVIATFVSAFFFVESPTAARNRSYDQKIVDSFNMIDSAVNQYYLDNNTLPTDLQILINDKKYYLTANDIINQLNNQVYVYEVVTDKTYKLCADFKASTFDQAKEGDSRYLYDKRWSHDIGYQCIEQKVMEKDPNAPGLAVPVKYQ